MNEIAVFLLTLGLPLKITGPLMEHSPLLQTDAAWIVALGKFLPAKFIRRGLSYLIPFLISATIVAIAVLSGALVAPIGAAGWMNLIYVYSGVAAVLPQFMHALKSKS